MRKNGRIQDSAPTCLTTSCGKKAPLKGSRVQVSAGEPTGLSLIGQMKLLLPQVQAEMGEGVMGDGRMGVGGQTSRWLLPDPVLGSPERLLPGMDQKGPEGS